MAAPDTHIAELDEGELRSFGLTTGALVAAIFGLLLPWLFDLNYPRWPWAVCAVLTIWALVAPRTLRLVYRGWMRVGLLLSRVTTPILMSVVFFVVVLPTGLLARLFREDVLRRKFEGDAESYRIPSKKHPQDQYERPF